MELGDFNLLDDLREIPSRRGKYRNCDCEFEESFHVISFVVLHSVSGLRFHASVCQPCQQKGEKS